MLLGPEPGWGLVTKREVMAPWPLLPAMTCVTIWGVLENVDVDLRLRLETGVRWPAAGVARIEAASGDIMGGAT